MSYQVAPEVLYQPTRPRKTFQGWFLFSFRFQGPRDLRWAQAWAYLSLGGAFLGTFHLSMFTWDSMNEYLILHLQSSTDLMK